MEYELVFIKSSREEATDALDYYIGISPELGDRFLNELDAVFEKLSKNPQYYSFISSAEPNTIRDIKLPSFPYVVVFEITGSIVYVYMVLNCHRKPPVL